MKAIELEYKKNYRRVGMSSADRMTFVGQEGERYWFCNFKKVDGREVYNGRSWMSESQIEKLLVEL